MQLAGERRTLLFLLLVLFLWPSARAQVKQAKAILLIEDQASAPATKSFATVFEEKFNSESSEQLEFYGESLDAGLDPLRLPQGSTLLNRQPTPWEEYRRSIVAFMAMLLLLASLLVYLLSERRRRRAAQQALEHYVIQKEKAEAALIELSRRLIGAREEEQSRIARELHDDFNQRLAVLAIKLKTTSKLVTNHPIASEQINELCEETGDIAADLQKLSHNLHSSVLYNLGLEDGLSNLCTEFTEQHGVEVSFTSQAVPEDLSRETSLCLFRVAQEGLNNVKKHSAATMAYVNLQGNEEEIELSIIDKGLGFDDRNGAFKTGLGLRSMQERVRTARGTIEIQSRYGAGTKISARIPIHNGA
jgi:signal transduction histidine kinase